MILLIDNYDSFTYNLAHYITALGKEIIIKRNDEYTMEDVIQLNPSHVIISPGPGTPEHAGNTVPLIKALAGKYPILGICLGHQAIAHAFGANIIHAKRIMHGNVSSITHDGSTLFNGLPSPFIATRYHSLAIDESSLPTSFNITAWTGEDNQREIMAIAHQDLPLLGVQFHPESILTEHGYALLENFFMCV